MATAKTGSNKKSPGKVRMLDGKVVKIVLYNGKAVGLGKYYSGYVETGDKNAMVSDMMILDENGKPKQFNEIGALEWA